MKFVTTIGVELTYTPRALDVALMRGADFEPVDRCPGELELCQGYVPVLQMLIDARDIPTWNGVHRDPGCVEVATKPYKTLNTLMKAVKGIGAEADAIGLDAKASYSGGGGAHVHTGIIGETEDARTEYRARMMIFAAQNPWISWAMLDVIDDINANPLTGPLLVDDNASRISYWTNRIDRLLERTATMERRLHRADTWCHRTHRLIHRNEIDACRRSILMNRRELRAACLNEKDVFKLARVSCQLRKDYTLRFSGYGEYGTIEFRCMEMGDADKIQRNVILANAICAYVAKQTYTEISLGDMPNPADVYNMTAEQAVAGWKRMLKTLGLKIKDYTAETRQIKARWAHYATEGGNPTGVQAPAPTSALGVAAIERCRQRHARRVARRESGRTAQPGGTGDALDEICAMAA